jgi:predicted transcriptional regulator of viral defense system
MAKPYESSYGIGVPERRQTFDMLVQRAAEQHGLVSTDDARELGIDPAYLRQMAASGRLEHLWRGVYRVRAIPVGAHDELHEAVFWAGLGAVIAGETALGLWGLADVNPRKVELALTEGRPSRRTVRNERVRILAGRVPSQDTDEVDNIPVVNAKTAIGQAIVGGTDSGLVLQAVASARGRQLIGEVTEARLRVALDDRDRMGRSAVRL